MAVTPHNPTELETGVIKRAQVLLAEIVADADGEQLSFTPEEMLPGHVYANLCAGSKVSFLRSHHNHRDTAGRHVASRVSFADHPHNAKLVAARDQATADAKLDSEIERHETRKATPDRQGE